MGVDKEFLDINKQVLKQFSQKLIKNKKDKDRLEKHLKNKNYFDFINGFETLILANKLDKSLGYIKGTNLRDLEHLYSFDVVLSKEIYSCIREFEVKLKASISYNFSKNFCSTKTDTLNYLNKSYYDLPKANSYDYEYLTKHYNKFPFFRTYDDISMTKKINYADFKKQYTYYLDHYNSPPFWVIIKQLNFNETYTLLGILKPQVMNDVLSDFNLNSNERDYLLSCTKLFVDLRNHCAHYELANRYRSKTGSYNEIKKKLPNINLLNVGKNKSSLVLFDTLCVLSKFSNTKSIYKVIQSYITITNLRLKQRLVKELLKRMGSSDKKKWRELT